MSVNLKENLALLIQLVTSAPLRSALAVSLFLHGLAAWSFLFTTLNQRMAPIAVTVKLDERSSDIAGADSKIFRGKNNQI